LFAAWQQSKPSLPDRPAALPPGGTNQQESIRTMAKIAKTADRKKMMDTSKSTDCPKCGKPTRIVKRLKDRERNVPGGIFISCSACEFFEKL
jgi:DNA-directed RNA polymerase subunit M/transcription elongation factor TFIIS